jgi:hypothetical protein
LAISSRCGRDARFLADQDAVAVHDGVAGRTHLLERVAQEVERGDARRCRAVGGKERADVAEPRGAEHRIDQRMRDHVAVGVPGQPAW